ncbi:hypothetical protein DPMN_099436 [Dreissena polymorpha]|uniref:Uncharacterized protein n=1 Tax=Dreissena polymorpha TaxID=45954 RepID=A0A9D4LH90_DREPO|nr:hypothetical protein DPMN_099436 [Dreissena polymorpha]
MLRAQYEARHDLHGTPVAGLMLVVTHVTDQPFYMGLPRGQHAVPVVTEQALKQYTVTIVKEQAMKQYALTIVKEQALKQHDRSCIHIWEIRLYVSA